ncbi:MAG: hybrid sensor histidine kinase/response regulator [bacterium]|nr:hybrid sensor histidine kinase/response regulator [bacterium]
MKRVMVVDDEETVRTVLERVLAGQYMVETAENGKIALEKLYDFQPDLILLDIDMPVLDGLETCKRIRQDEKFKFVKLLMLSGRVSLEDRLAGYETGADDYIKKPFDPVELRSKIDAFMRLKHIEEVDRLKYDFLTLMAHETYTPMHGIFTPATMLINEPDMPPEEVRAHVKDIYDSAVWLHENFKKMMLLLKLKSGWKMNFSGGSVNEYLGLAVSNLESAILEKEVTVNMDIPNTVELNADWELLGIAFLYIVGNAVKYSHKKGRIEISSIAKEKHLEVSVKDYGVGIQPERIADIFNEFNIDNVLHHQKGIGTSLAICRYIMKSHSGTITAESHSGKDTTFTLTFPYKG